MPLDKASLERLIEASPDIVIATDADGSIAYYNDGALGILGYSRDEIVALWSFTTTGHPELAMDEASQRMPLPADLLIDPDTDKVHLPIAERDPLAWKRALTAVAAADGPAARGDLDMPDK